MSRFVYEVTVRLFTKSLLLYKKKIVNFIIFASNKSEATGLAEDYLIEHYIKNKNSLYELINVERKYKQESCIVYIDEK